VNPWIVDFAAYDFWLRPLGLLWLGAVLENNGIDTTLIDCLDRRDPSQAGANLQSRPDGTGRFLKTELPKPDILEFVPRTYGRYGITEGSFIDRLEQAGRPDAVLVTSSMTYWYPGVNEAIEIVKSKWPGVPVALGGRYATLCPEHAVSNTGADHVFEGPFERGAGELLSGILDVDIEIPGAYAGLPPPAHRLYGQSDIAAMVLTRGCPFRCSYCVSGLLFPGFEKRNIDECIEEAGLLSGMGVRHVALYDDALLVDPDDVIMPFLRAMTGEGYGMNFYTPNALHAGMVTPEIADLMKEAGFSHLRIGFESDDPAFQRDTGGKVTTTVFERAAESLLAAGFPGKEIGAYILCGHPRQTAGQIRSAMKLAANAGIEPVLAEYSPIPGSRDFEEAARTFKHSPAADPLLHNSSIILYQHPSISMEEFHALKNECSALRNGIRDKWTKH